jgi:hypothetical protein
MKITAMTILAVAAATAAQAHETATAAERTVTVCVEGGIGFDVMLQAKNTASAMFAGIGVRVAWHRGLGGCPAQGIMISLSTGTPAKHLPHALAYALPYEGTHIVVFYDRIQGTAAPSLTPRLLAHVLVHEITHILQGVSRHSRTGVMKAQWEGPDYTEMAWKPLPFAPEDIDLIYRGLEGREARLAGARLLAAAPVK